MFICIALLKLNFMLQQNMSFVMVATYLWCLHINLNEYTKTWNSKRWGGSKVKKNKSRSKWNWPFLKICWICKVDGWFDAENKKWCNPGSITVVTDISIDLSPWHFPQSYYLGPCDMYQDLEDWYSNLTFSTQPSKLARYLNTQLLFFCKIRITRAPPPIMVELTRWAAL